MAEFIRSAEGLAWPLAVAFAWLAGELAQRWRVPRITAYSAVGFLFAPTQLGVLPSLNNASGMLASVAFGLILFEFGYRINLHWFRINPWLTGTGLLESGLCFGAAYGLARFTGQAPLTGLLLASLCMATSPAALGRLVNDLHSSGQVTERALHLSALNCMLAVFAFRAVVGFWSFDTSGDLLKALSDSAVELLVSAALGCAFGLMLPPVLRRVGHAAADGTLAFAITVMLVVAVAHAYGYSPLVASFALGLVARHRRITLDQAQRNFGVLGELLAVFMFVHVAASLEWSRVWAGLGLGVGLVLVRMLAQLVGVTLLALPSGTSLRKGALTGLAMTPLSAFVVLLMDDTRNLGVDLIDTLAPLAAATLILALLAPIMTQLALLAAGEAQDQKSTRPRAWPSENSRPPRH